MSLITQDKFDELVNNTTHYLTDLLKRTAELEKKVEELSKPKRSAPAKKAEEANDE